MGIDGYPRTPAAARRFQVEGGTPLAMRAATGQRPSEKLAPAATGMAWPRTRGSPPWMVRGAGGAAG